MEKCVNEVLIVLQIYAKLKQLAHQQCKLSER